MKRDCEGHNLHLALTAATAAETPASKGCGDLGATGVLEMNDSERLDLRRAERG